MYGKVPLIWWFEGHRGSYLTTEGKDKMAMGTTLLMACWWCLLWLVLFWLTVVLLYWALLGFDRRIFTSKGEGNGEQEKLNWEETVRRELANFRKDVLADKDKGEDKALQESGLAENRTNAIEDECKDLPGSWWLCDGRPLLLAFMQSVFFIPAACLACALVQIIGGGPISMGWLRLICLVTFTVVTGFMIYHAYVIVVENEVIGVKRFGRQLNGYLQAGLQFLVPWFERYEIIPLKNLVWGPHEEDQDGAGGLYYVKGTAGENNLKPGVFVLLLVGRWTVRIEVQVTMRVQKSKAAWYMMLNTYATADEIGQQIAAVVGAVLTRKVRELQQDKEEDLSDELEAQEYVRRLTELQNYVPEIAVDIMEALLLIRGRLPLIFLGVAVTGPIASPELQQLLQARDEAEVDKLQLEKLMEALQQADALNLAGPLLQLNSQEVWKRLFAGSGTGGSSDSSLDTLLRILAANKARSLTE